MGEFGDADQTIKMRLSAEGQEDVKEKVEEVLNILKNIQQQSKKIQDTASQTSKAQVSASSAAKASYDNEMKSHKEWSEFLNREQQQKRQQTKEWLVENQQQANMFKQTKIAVDSTKDSYIDLRTALSSFGGIGSMLATALTGPLGIILTIIASIKVLGTKLKEAAQAGYEFAKAVYQLQIGINAIRKTGVEITLQDVYNNLDKLQAKFGIFSRKELVEGSAQLINLTRDFGFTKDRIFELQNAIATLAVVNGRAMDDVQRTAALAISSGYTEGLQRLGVSINRVTIALEAQRLGYGRNYMSLTEQQRAQATYNLILQKTKKYQDDLEEYQKTAPGRIDRAKASFTNLATTIGEQVIPVWADFVGWLGKSAEALENNIKKATELRAKGIYSYGSRYGTAQYVSPTPRIEKSKEPIIETGFLKNAIEDYENLMESLNEASSALWDKTLEIQEDYTEQLNDNYEDWLRKKEDLLIRYNQKLDDIEQQYVQKLEDLDIKVAQQKEDAWRRYYQELEDINIWYNQAIANENYEYQQKLLKSEEDFQNKMRDLRQKFLFDLEDAIQERDAKQAMLLIRRYNFDRQKAQQEREDNREELKRQYLEELAELKRQKARKLAEARDELNRKFEDIQREYQRELEELQIWKQREYEERELWYQRELEQAEKNYKYQNERAAKSRNDALKDMVKDFTKEYKLTAKKWSELLKLTDAYIGENGALRLLMKNFQAFWLMANPLLFPSTLSPMQQVNWGGAYASGGEITVSKPTLALFGEGGMETATFTRGNSKSSAHGELGIKLYLSEDLRAEIVEDALGEFDNVLVSIERSQR
jgi:hypothetical protein